MILQEFLDSIWLPTKSAIKAILLKFLGMKFSTLYLIALGIALIWPTIARRSFQASPFPGQANSTAGSSAGNRTLQGLLRPGGWIFLASFLSFIAFLYIAFTLNDPYLLWNIDGKRFEYLVRQQHVWFPFYFGYTNDFLHSLGNIWYPLNMKLDPGFLLATDPSDGSLDRRLSYLIFSMELYLSTFLLGVLLRQGVVISSIAGWVIVLLAMPFQGLPAIYPVLAMAPNYPLSQTVLMLCVFRLTGRSRDRYSAALTVAIAFLLAHTSLAHPTAIVLMAPILLIFSASILAASDTRRELIVKLISVVAVCGLLAILGFPGFLSGIFQYTAPYYFSSELFNDRAFYYFVSIAFHRNDAGWLLFLLALIGAVSIARFGGRFERAFAAGLLLAMALLIGAGAFTVAYYQSWRGPSPIYFEFFLWPIYAIFAAATFRVLYYSGSVLFRWAVERLPAAKVRLNGVRAFHAVVVAALLCLPWALLKHLNPGFVQTSNSLGLVKPPAETEIVSMLRKEVGLQPGSLFTGRVATLTGQNLDRPVNWHDLNGLDSEILSHGGNSHQSTGLWWYGIPTLFELSSLITPPFFLITREFLERPGDLQMRNAILLRQFDPRVLRALGVRFVITDAPIKGRATLRVRQEMPTSTKHYLYELNGVNRGDYSPTRVEAIPDVTKTIAALSDTSFDFARTAIVETPLQVELVHAKSGQVHVEPGYLRLSATSKGTSLLVLPFEFSHCLSLEPSGVDADKDARILRVNLLQAGILFTRKLDATLTYFTGPFRNSGCRIEDRRDMDRLGIRQFHKEIVLPPSRFPGLE
ncbi:MAG TPA: hypothetical protein VN929_04195 [Burkholderiales bacterium]|nr:hypothetical protein [Burkholderiales bacterium]